MMKVTLYGAAGDVTGSAYLLESSRARILVDFGMFQGGRELEARNVLPTELNPSALDAVLLTHAHLDHVGRLPLLEKNGFQGTVFCTAPTRELAGLILRDSAKIQHYTMQRVNRKRRRAGQKPLPPLYDSEDVEAVLQRFQVVEYEKEVSLPGGLVSRFINAGHMLGSASIKVEEVDSGKAIVFSGDIGPNGMALIRDADHFQNADVVFMESTYGDRDHRSQKATLEEFEEILGEAVQRKSRILVPSFAVGRTQQLIYHIDELFCDNRLDPFPVYLDSPMAIEATKIYRKHPDLFDQEALDLRKACDIARRQDHLTTTSTPQESMALNHVKGPCLIMAGSGMCTGGRIVHHLKHGLWQAETVVLMVGYQAAGSLGRRLVDGAESVRIFGDEIAVKARIHTLNGFSAHAGQTELLEWVEHLAGAGPEVYLTHGEARGREPLAEQIRRRFGLKVYLPEFGEQITL